jgi:hypothetical protein
MAMSFPMRAWTLTARRVKRALALITRRRKRLLVALLTRPMPINFWSYQERLLSQSPDLRLTLPQLDQLGQEGLREYLDRRVWQDLVALRERQVLKALEARQVLSDLQVPQGRQVLMVPPVLLARLALQGRLDPLAKAQLVLQVLRGRPAFRVRLALSLALLVGQVLPARLARKVLLALLA